MKPLALPLALLALCACSSDRREEPAARTPASSQPSAQALPPGALLRLDLEGLPHGAPPAGWWVAETLGAGTPAIWSVRAAPGGGNALLLAPQPFPADLELSVRVRADSGQEDRGGGLVWRAEGPDDYYIARWNPLERNVRVYLVERGVRKLLQSADIDTAAGEWHTLTVSMIGDRMSVALDGAPLLDTTDPTFDEGGRIGLWTKADAATWFDDLSVREPPRPAER